MAAILALTAIPLSGGCNERSEPSPARSPNPNLILLVLDTTRADHLSAYGYSRETTPHLAAFAEDAIRFERAYSTSSWTLASHASLFTGLLPATHRATQENLRLDAELDTIAELLAARGYETAAFTNNSWISDFTQLSQGFERVEALWRQRDDSDGDPHKTQLAVLEWLERRESDRPFFLFVNLMEPHWPYDPPSPHRELFQSPGIAMGARKNADFPAIHWYLRRKRPPPEVLRARVDLYDAEISYLDQVVGTLLATLARHTDLNNALVVITADHGENLGGHGHQGHSFTLYDSTLRVPLLIRPPGGVGSATLRSDPVQLTDVFATLASAAGIDSVDDRVVGLPLLDEPLPEDRPLIAEYYRPKTFIDRFPKSAAGKRAVARYQRRIRSIQVGPDKFIWGSDGNHELYDTMRDPDETTDLLERTPERARTLQIQLDEIIGRLSRDITDPQGTLSEVDAATAERLRALGYIP